MPLDDTNVRINLDVAGTAKLKNASNTIADVSQNLRDVSHSINDAIKGLDRLERSLSGTGAKGKQSIDSLAQSAKEYYKVLDTNKGKDVRPLGVVANKTTVDTAGTTGAVSMAPSSRVPQSRDTLGKYISDTEAASRADRALEANRRNGAKALKALEIQTILNNLASDKYSHLNEVAAKSTRQLAFDIASSSANLPRLRYALYDVSNAIGIFGLAMLTASGLSLKMAIDFQRNFADVQRTSGVAGSAVTTLYNQFVNLFETMPSSFDDLTKIGELGGQLGVASSDLANFTSLVTKFSAVTGISVEEAATAFGRLSTLLKVPGDQLENLGSSIAKVGVESVATESEIIKTAQEIASTGHVAGLTADQVVGLSAELASLGIKPELSRGTVTKFFTKLQTAVNEGGKSLDAFSRISGMSSEAFKAAYGKNTMSAVLAVLKGVASAGTDADAALSELGLTSLRDRPTLKKLSQDVSGLEKALADSAEGMRSNSEINRQYNIITSTTAEKLKVLGNNFQSLLSTIGQGGLAFNGLIDVAIGFLRVANNIAKNPILSWFVGMAVAIGVVVGAGAILVAGLLRVSASVFAARTALDVASGGTAKWSVALRVLALSLTGATIEGGKFVAMTGAAAAGSQVAGDAALAGGAKMATGFRGAAAALFGLPGLIAAVGIALGAMATGGLQEVSHGLNDAFGRTKTIDQFAAKISNGTITKGFDDIGAHIQKVGGFWNDFRKNTDIFKNSSFSLAAEEINKFDQALASADPVKAADAIKRLGLSADEVKEKLPLYYAAYKEDGGAMGIAALREKEVADARRADIDSIDEKISAVLGDIKATQEQESSLYNLGEAMQASGSKFDQLSETGRASMGALMDVVNAIAAQTPGDAEATANSLQGLFDSIVSQVPSAAGSLGFLKEIIESLGGATASTPIDITSLIDGFNTAAAAAAKAAKKTGGIGKAAGSAAKEVRTLSDYANDLADVFTRAFDIRFSGQSAMDDITDKWRDLNEELAEYRRKVLELTADRNTTAYFLSVAEAFKDTLRADELRSDLADTDAELADAQSVTNKTLVGNSKAATKNRGVITDLVSSYEDYIKSLANSGASQDTLRGAIAKSKKSFEDQALSLGFSRTEIGKYSKAFDDVTLAVARVPRKITVSANTNPALQALNEFLAKAKKSKVDVGVGMGDLLGVDQAAKNAQDAWRKAFERYMKQRPIAIDGYLIQGQQVYKVPGTNLKMYDTGGYTGSGARLEPKGIVHAEEFVINQDATRTLGLPLLNYMNKYGALPGFTQGPVAAPSANNNTTIVELSPTDRGLLAAAGHVTLTLDGRIIADSTNNINGVYAKRGQ